MMMKIKLPETETILYGLALAQTLGIAYAAVMYESGNGSLALMVLAGARGVLLGAALSFGTAVAAQKAPRVGSKRARQIGYLALGGLLTVSPVIMAPAIMAAMPAGMSLVLAPAGLWAVAVAVAVAPDLVAVAVATQSHSLQPVQPAAAAAERMESDIHAGKGGVAAGKGGVAAPRPYVCANCEREFASQNALNAHERAHKPIKIDQSLLIK